ncbi:hypothetical protein [Streptomyces sp. NPDC060001]|uniref:hypothetical protein n=1 Tax=Streptomyces sp. NPDC060001 TaxID=3347032 RepID=UPI0036B77E3E
MAPSPSPTGTLAYYERQIARLRDQLAILAGARPTPEQLADEDDVDKDMARRIHQARPDIPVHHILATLEAFRAVLEMEETGSEKCCVCGSGSVTYHNYREHPFCGPCADPISATEANMSTLVAIFAEVLSAFGPVSSHTGVQIGWAIPHPVLLDDFDRWNAALKPFTKAGA